MLTTVEVKQNENFILGFCGGLFVLQCSGLHKISLCWEFYFRLGLAWSN